MRAWTRTVVAAALVLTVSAAARADLEAFIKRPEPVFQWENLTRRKADGVTTYEIRMVSQEWQGHTWEHRLYVFEPDNVQNKHVCTLMNTGGSAGADEQFLAAQVAKRTRSCFAIMGDNPNQPLYGLREDALIVYTWQKFLETGDESWPLHFPMAKAVIKAMDVIQNLSGKTFGKTIDEFVITGASKRGWTTWLVGASRDRRVKAIAPMVIDVLNVVNQIPHQLEAYGGKASEQVDDYTRTGMINMLNTEKGKRLMELEDPYSYREVLKVPKLVILGTNDRYWSQDSLNLYWNELKGPKWVLYVPNSGHGLEDRARVIDTMTALTRAVSTAKPLPTVIWTHSGTDAAATLKIHASEAPTSARIFSATSSTRDFRNSKWTDQPVPVTGPDLFVKLPAPETGYAARFVELTFGSGNESFNLSTQLRILGSVGK